MENRTVMASVFKQQCLALLDQVERAKITVVVTKRGKPVAQLVPLEHDERGRQTMGSVELMAPEDEAYFSTGDDWEADAASA